ncbi:choice-of-anchor L domain-containing protein [Salipiger sp.]|uniref:choice-of-anchor L domain-containing protein n=1 Tax=Salipiger sp. TaxID=2078585 RepID=UPI003A97FB3E
MKTSSFGVAIAAALVSSSAFAATVTTDNVAANLAAATLGASSGITIQSGSETLGGVATQQGTYAGFDQNGLTMSDGVVLTTGSAAFGTDNTSSSISNTTGTAAYQPMVDLAAANALSTVQNDTNVLSFDFILDNALANAVTGQFLFATDEFPDQSVTDIMAIFVNGVNYAFFPNGDLVSNQSGNPNDFFNDNTANAFSIEWDGLTDVFTFTALANGGNAINNITFAVADTSDSGYDSALFITGLQSTTTSGSGGIGETSTVPLPAAGWLLLAGLGGIAGLRRRRRA